MSNIAKLLILIGVVIFIILISAILVKNLHNMPEGEEDMATEIINIYKEELPAMRFIGKKYVVDDMENNTFSNKWDEWFHNGWFEQIEALTTTEWLEKHGDYIGLERMHQGGDPFEYSIGIFMPPDTKVPEGFIAVDFPATELGVGWVKGKMPEVFWAYDEVSERLVGEGYISVFDEKGNKWSYERYNCPRFTEEDADGNVILDYVFVIGYPK